ncbi:receptor-type tyrosine-protein phosphatase N2 isoform X2 [Astyanax mexicanus]|uniref:receptor-type tyrosine-protein phosphatase N2 isoform X2 n=1 Tax=Astyanax mexicanus TaxID=7994 RepID=UPI0020CB3C67|nr:receptor-type tyrosine-protein phosphatase N2 isoform X2 [Astyanax mexicanus]
MCFTGCLFEDDLCEPYEVCANDGLFGQCVGFPGEEVYGFDASPASLQRLRNALQKLAHQGYTWQDDITQQVISRELLALPKIPLRHLGNPLPTFRAQTAEGGSRKLKGVEAHLGRTLESYLQELGFLPPDVTSSKQSLQGKYKGKAGLSAVDYNYMQPKEKPPPLLQPPPKPKQASPNTSSLSALLSRLEPDGSGRLSELQQILSKAELVGPTPGRFQYISLQRTPAPKEEKPPAASRPPPRPRLHRLLFRPGVNRPAAKDSLSSVDEKFIQGVVSQLGQQSVNVDTMTPGDLDQLSGVIAQALQVVDKAEGVKGREVTEDEEKEMKREQDGKTEERSPKSENKDKGFISDLLEYLDRTSGPGAVDQAQAEEPFLGFNLHGASGGPKPVGLENVQSRTTQTKLDLMKKKMEPDTLDLERLGDGEVDQWLRGAKGSFREEPLEKMVNSEAENKGPSVKEKFRMDVAAFSSPRHDGYFGYIITEDSLSTNQGLNLMKILAERVKLHVNDFLQLSVLGPAVTFRVRPNIRNITTALLAKVAVEQKGQLEKASGVKILEAGLSDKTKLNQIPIIKHSHVEPSNFLVLSMVSVAFIAMVLGLSGALFCMRHRSHYKLKDRLASLGTDTSHDATAAYQDLCRQRMAVQTSERGSEVFHPTHTHTSRINSVSSQFSDGPTQSPSARSSTSSWSEEPHSNMDISTGHMILSYMEDHLQNRDRLQKEWEALCGYQAEPASCSISQDKQNTKKNRPAGALAYDHSRFTLKSENNHGSSDYINASLIMDHDPRNPAYISAQGPLPNTVADFWQMVWESGCVVIVMLTPLAENGTKQCHQYWPDEGSDLYHIYEVNLVSEHIWCEDFLVRSFYLKNVQTNETRTVTQFHFLSWMDQSVPESARTLLDFRRKVNKCYRGRSCPIIIHCSDGSGRSGTYILIDMVLNKMAKGAKEIDIAATLEHLRDQRAGMVHTKDQFEFALTAVAEEVNAILKALPQ